MRICQSCYDTGCCPHCGGSGKEPVAYAPAPRRSCGICLGSGDCVECCAFDPVDPAGLYARAVQCSAMLASLAADHDDRPAADLKFDDWRVV